MELRICRTDIIVMCYCFLGLNLNPNAQNVVPRSIINSLRTNKRFWEQLSFDIVWNAYKMVSPAVLHCCRSVYWSIALKWYNDAQTHTVRATWCLSFVRHTQGLVWYDRLHRNWCIQKLFFVSCIHCLRNMFSKPLASNDRRDAPTDSHMYKLCCWDGRWHTRCLKDWFKCPEVNKGRCTDRCVVITLTYFHLFIFSKKERKLKMCTGVTKHQSILSWISPNIQHTSRLETATTFQQYWCSFYCSVSWFFQYLYQHMVTFLWLGGSWKTQGGCRCGSCCEYNLL